MTEPKTYVRVRYQTENGFSPYPRMVHDPKYDAPIDLHRIIEEAMQIGAIEDGDEFTISFNKTGRRPFGDRKFVWVAPHTYSREPAK